MSDQPDNLIIDLKTAEAVVNYLAQKPYIEVFQLVALMQQLQPLPAPAQEPLRLPTGQGGIALAAQQASRTEE